METNYYDTNGPLNLKSEPHHPENGIQLLDGTILTCFELENPEKPVENNLHLDTTGRFLQFKRPKPSPATPSEPTEKDKIEQSGLELMEKYAWILLRNADRILSDSRMFLCPVNVQNGLMYTGYSGFLRPTLGIYIEWWKNVAGTMLKDKEERSWLIYKFGGSPLTGMNRCCLLAENGEKKSEQVSHFKDLWVPFMRINSRYSEAKSRYKAFELEEVLEILLSEGRLELDQKTQECFSLQLRIKKLFKKLRDKTIECEDLLWRYKYNIMDAKRAQLQMAYAEYQGVRDTGKVRIEQINEERREQRKRLKSGELDEKEYYNLVHPIMHEKRAIISNIQDLFRNRVEELFPGECIDADDAVEYLNIAVGSDVKSKS